MAYNKRDFYYKKAKSENFAARSIYKLEEMDRRFRFFKQGMRVLDLGAAPGSWSQYASNKIGQNGKLLGIDLEAVKLTLPNAIFIHADLRDINLDQIIQSNGFETEFDVVMSDMAPKTTGVRVTDQVRSLELCELALSVATRFLKRGGSFIVKLFHSEGFEGYRKLLRENFEKVEIIRPKSTRKESKEIFLVGVKFKGAPAKGAE